MIDTQNFMEFGKEVVTVIAQENRTRGLFLASFPKLTDNSFRKRMDDMDSGRGKGRVNFPSIVKKYVRANFSGFKPRKKTFDDHVFEKKISDELTLVFVFKKRRLMGAGKAFTVLVGCECSNSTDPVWWRHSLFQFFDREELDWTYGLDDELHECLHESYVLLGFVIEQLEELLSEFVGSNLSSVLSGRSNYGRLTFYGASEIAYESVLKSGYSFTHIDGAWLGDKKTWRFEQPYRSVASESAFSGKSCEGQAWLIRFIDPIRHKAVIVGVPYEGRISLQCSNSHTSRKEGVGIMRYAARDPRESLSWQEEPFLSGTLKQLPNAPWKNLCDSSEAVEAAIDAGLGEFSNQYPQSSSRLQLYATLSDPSTENEFWHISAHSVRPQDQKSWTCKINAHSREVFEISQQ